MNKCLSCRNFINGVIKKCAKYPRVEYYGELTANPLVAMCGEFERKMEIKEAEK